MRKPLPAIGSAAVLSCIFTVCAMSQVPEQPNPKKEEQKPPSVEQEAVVTCPTLTLKAPTQPVRDGVPIKITATLAGGNIKEAPMFDWSISAGVINSGQGTPSIDVDTTGAGTDRAIYATVVLGGLPAECVSSGSVAAVIAGPANKHSEFGPLSIEEQTAHLDDFLSNVTPNDQAYIFVYAGRTDPRGHAATNLRLLRAHALKSGIPSERLVTIDGGFREQASSEFWIVPLGAEPPRPSPTVNAREIVYPKVTPVRKKP